MKKVIIQFFCVVLIIIQVTAVLFLIDHKNSATAQCIPAFLGLRCNRNFTAGANGHDGSCGQVNFTCQDNRIVSAVYTGGSCGGGGGETGNDVDQSSSGSTGSTGSTGSSSGGGGTGPQ